MGKGGLFCTGSWLISYFCSSVVSVLVWLGKQLLVKSLIFDHFYNYIQVDFLFYFHSILTKSATVPPKPYASISTIIGQPEEHLRKALSALCADDEVREKAYLFMTKLARHAKELELKNKAPDNTSKGVKRDLKTMLDVEICIQCNQTFHEDDNNGKSCWHHECTHEFANRHGGHHTKHFTQAI